MVRFLGYLFLFYIIYFVVKYIVRIYSSAKTKNDNIRNSHTNVEKKSQIDKEKVVDAKYEEL